jgi:predicted amidohydrolase YtcJ
MSTLVLRDAEVDGVVVDVGVDDGRVTTIGPARSVPGVDVEIDCAGGAVLPGLHDHHLHLLAMAAAAGSVDVSGDLDGSVRAAHAAAAPGASIRAVNYDETVEGALDRWRLDSLAPGRAVRVQHRSGAMWVLSTEALERAGVMDAREEGIERDELDRPTGRLLRLDGWLHDRLSPPDTSPTAGLGVVGRRLASYGVTGVTDCTPTASVDYFEALAAAVRAGQLPVTVSSTGGPELSATYPPAPLQRGPVKVLISDHALPALDDLSEWFRGAHRAGRAVAVHCVTRAALVLALAAWREVGSVPGDRIEHASVTPAEAVSVLAGLSLTVVTQPAFVAARGDVYLAEVEPSDRPDLYRCASLLDAGVAVGGSTDAPFGPEDPWVAVRAAVERRAPSGAAVGCDRGLGPASALDLFLGPLERPGGPARRVRPGVPADLCVLDAPLATVLLDPSSRHVAATIRGGKCTFAA